MAAAFAHSAGWERKVCHTVALAGLLHDLGMMRVSLKVIRKAGPLSPAERDHVELHTRLGYELLAQNDGVPDALHGWPWCHQERTGMARVIPRGLPAKAYPPWPRLNRESISGGGPTNPRGGDDDDAFSPTGHFSSDRPWPSCGNLRGKQFDSDLADAFSRFLGWGPPGTLMRLADGRMAVALQHARRRGFVRWCDVLHRRGEGVEFGIEVDLADFPQGSAAEWQSGKFCWPDGTAGISHPGI